MTERADIGIVAFDFLDEDLMKDLKRHVQEVFPDLRVKAELQTAFPIPVGSLNSRRHQFLSRTFLDTLEYLLPRTLRILGIVNVDLYASEFPYIFGYARLSGREAIISLARLREEFYKKPESREILYRRARVEAIHELGHTFGLEHCYDPHCVMYLSHGIADTDRKSDRYCDQCHPMLNSLNSKSLAQGHYG